MSTSKHTYEQWNTSRTYYGDILINGAPSQEGIRPTIAKMVGDSQAEYAKRIVACVSACAGIEDPAATLEEVTSLLEELESLAGLSQSWEESRYDVQDRLVAVLAKLGKG